MSAECVGCGYCCRKAPCVVAHRVYGNGITSCPALRWDGMKYRCKLCETPGEVGRSYRHELSAGAGCCSSFNTDRQRIPSPQELEMSQLPVELVAVLRALGGEFMSSDALWLALNSAEKRLKRPGFAEYCMGIVTSHRSAGVESFMG